MNQISLLFHVHRPMCIHDLIVEYRSHNINICEFELMLISRMRSAGFNC